MHTPPRRTVSVFATGNECKCWFTQYRICWANTIRVMDWANWTNTPECCCWTVIVLRHNHNLELLHADSLGPTQTLASR